MCLKKEEMPEHFYFNGTNDSLIEEAGLCCNKILITLSAPRCEPCLERMHVVGFVFSLNKSYEANVLYLQQKQTERAACGAHVDGTIQKASLLAAFYSNDSNCQQRLGLWLSVERKCNLPGAGVGSLP